MTARVAIPQVEGLEPETSACPAAPSPGERLLLATMRGWAHARVSSDSTELVARALAVRTSARVGALFVAWIQAVEAGCVRAIQIQRPRCGGLSDDEQRLIIACGLAPADPRAAERLLAPLLVDPTPVALLGRSLNAALVAEGWRLPVRLLTSSGHPMGHTPTLH